MTIVVLKVIALIFQRIERLIFDLPPRPATAHQGIDGARAHPQVRHPTKMLHLGSAKLPVLDKIDSHVRVRGIERHVIDKAKAMPKTRAPVLSLVIGYAPGVLRRLDLLEQKGMIALFDPEDVVQIMGVQRLDVRGIGTQAVFGDDRVPT